MAKTMSPMLLGRQIDGLWHTGIVAYGLEYFYGSHGIAYVEPGKVGIGRPTEIADLGTSEIPYEVFQEFLVELEKDRFKGSKYHVWTTTVTLFPTKSLSFSPGREFQPRSSVCLRMLWAHLSAKCSVRISTQWWAKWTEWTISTRRQPRWRERTNGQLAMINNRTVLHRQLHQLLPQTTQQQLLLILLQLRSSQNIQTWIS